MFMVSVPPTTGKQLHSLNVHGAQFPFQLLYSHGSQCLIVHTVSIIDRQHCPFTPIQTLLTLSTVMDTHVEMMEEESDGVVVCHVNGPCTVGVTGIGNREARTCDLTSCRRQYTGTTRCT